MTIKEHTIKQNPVPRIIYRNSEVVEDYLLVHPNISIFLKAIWPTLIRYFGQSISIELEVLYYPDEMDEEELVGWIQYVGDVEEGLEILEEFEDGIFDQQITVVGTTFNFNIEFV